MAPLLSVEGTATLAISTPDDELNYYSELINLPGEDGKPLFKSIQIGLSCKKCIAKGVMTQCKHTLNRLPMWKTPTSQKKTEMVMAANPEQSAREVGGVIVGGNNFLFQEFVARFTAQITNNLYTLTTQPGVVHIAIDPSGGGTSSDYAICSHVQIRGQHIIVGIDASPSAKSDDVEEMIINHVHGLRQRFPMALFVMYIESNAHHIHSDRISSIIGNPDYVDYFGKVLFARPVKKDHRDLIGIRTTHTKKIMYAKQLREYLQNETIFFCDTVTTSAENVVTLKKKLIKQMGMYRRDVKMPSDPLRTENRKVTFSGKGATAKDDLIMVLQILLFHARLKLADKVFVEYCRENNHSLFV